MKTINEAHRLSHRYSAHAFTLAVPEDEILGHGDLPPKWFGVIRGGIALRLAVDPTTYDFELAGAHVPGDLVFPEAFTNAVEDISSAPSVTSAHRIAPEDQPHGGHFVQSLTPMTILAFDVEAVKALLPKDPTFATALARLFAVGLSEQNERRRFESAPSAQRLAWLLHHLHVIEGGISYSQQKLAAALALSRETVTGTLQLFKEAGIVDVEPTGRRSRVRVRDVERLERLFRQKEAELLKARKAEAQQPSLPTMMEP